ncbi:hypothetical protein L596_000447 [Steinernema carpocapsae]|uniref:Uncharacterized protein n=1 Tax=Steinernema carpocapsae TaxID=34508 RepID=A0A4U8UI29_STECR|nr:hypothetical protein L596_000447 [Steinernema carpocapsae]
MLLLLKSEQSYIGERSRRIHNAILSVSLFARLVRRHCRGAVVFATTASKSTQWSIHENWNRMTNNLRCFEKHHEADKDKTAAGFTVALTQIILEPRLR